MSDHQYTNDLIGRLVALTRDLILIPSTSTRPDDRERCFRFVVNHLEAVKGVEVRAFCPGDIPCLIAAPQGVTRPEILLCAHLDVIAHPDPDTYRSEIKGGRIYGAGAGDMKGALAILLELFRSLHQRSPGISLGLMVTSDEELGGVLGARYLFEKVGFQAGLAINPDGGSLTEISIEEKGALHIKCVCHGTSAHAAKPWLGNNPLEHLMERVQVVKESFDQEVKGEDHWHPTCAVTMWSTPNQSSNRIPSQAEVILDVRFIQPETVKGMMIRIRDLLGKRIEVQVLLAAEPLSLNPDPLFLEVTEEVSGEKVSLTRDHGASDSRILAEFGVPVIMSRPTIGDIHSEKEWIDIQSMEVYYRICERYLERKFSL